MRSTINSTINEKQESINGEHDSISQIAIVGSDLAAWQFALGLARLMPFNKLNIQVISKSGTDYEDKVITASPTLAYFHKLIRVDEKKFMQTCEARFHLADHYCSGEDFSFYLGYSEGQRGLDGVSLSHLLAKLVTHSASDLTKYLDLTQYSLAAVAEESGKFAFSNHPDIAEQLAYGYCFSAKKYLEFSQELALQAGVKLTLVDDFQWRDDSEASQNLSSESLVVSEHGVSRMLDADLYIDCTEGADVRDDFNALIDVLHTELNTPIKNDGSQHESNKTTKYQYCDQRLSVTAHSQSHCSVRTIELIFPKEVLSADASRLDGLGTDNNLAQRVHRWGYVHRPWNSKRLLVGAAAVCLGDLVVSSLQLVQSALLRFIELFPDQSNIDDCAREFNALSCQEYQRVAEFHLAQLLLPGKKDNIDLSQLEKICPVLANKLAVFQSAGVLPPYEGESIGKDIWASFFLHLGIFPTCIDPMVDTYSAKDIKQVLDRRIVQNASLVRQMPNKADYLLRYLSGA